VKPLRLPAPARHVSRWRSAAGCLTVTACAIVLAATTATADPAATATPSGAKSSAPMNVNPGKHPVTDRARIAPEPSVPLTADQAVREALAWAAQDPNSRVACFAADGTLAGMAELDRVDPGRPLTAAQRAEVCSRSRPPGSKP
jgi:hypothetical protein